MAGRGRRRSAAGDGPRSARRSRVITAPGRGAKRRPRAAVRAPSPSAEPRVVRVGLVQMRCLADLDANLARAERQVRAAARRGATIVCLPELFRSLYFCQSEDHDNFALAEAIPGPT